MVQKKETNIQNRIRLELCKKGCLIFRCNTGNFLTKYGQEIKIGQVGHSDLYGIRDDGKAIFLEVKTPIGKASKEQKNFIKAVKNKGALAGFAHSVEEAINIVFPKKEEQ